MFVKNYHFYSKVYSKTFVYRVMGLNGVASIPATRNWGTGIRKGVIHMQEG